MTNLFALTLTLLLGASAVLLEPGVARAADDPPTSDSRTTGPTDSGSGRDAMNDAMNAELDAKLEAARAKLEQAAHEVAELSSRMSGPFIDRLMILSGDGSRRAILGVQLDEASDKGGARIQEVSPGGPAAEAGLKTGDVIVEINGKDVRGDRTANQVLHLMRDIAPDSKVKVRVLRDGKPRDFVITARPRPDFPEIPEPPPIPDFPLSGAEFPRRLFLRAPWADMELATLTPQLGRYFGTETGVLVVRAPKGDGLKLEDGDVILAIDGREPTSGSHATRILSSYQPGEKVSIRVMRQHKTMNVESTLPDRHVSERKTKTIRKEEAPA